MLSIDEMQRRRLEEERRRKKRMTLIRSTIWGDPPLGGSTTPAAWSPSALFASGEKGVWYDPSDLTTLFQDSTGTTPVTATGDPVGLILDKSKGLVRGSDIVTNPGPYTVTTGYTIQGTGTLTVDASRLKVSQAAAWNDGVYYELPVNSFSTPKEIYLTIEMGTATLIQLQLGYIYGNGNKGFINITASGTYRIQNVVFDNGVSGITVKSGGADYFFISALSCKELPGNHASQATAASRPVYRDVGGYQYLEFDGVDDSLDTAAIDFTATDKMSIFAGINRVVNTAGRKPIMMFNGDPYSVNGTFEFDCPWDGSDVAVGCRGSQRSAQIFALVASLNVLTAECDLRAVTYATSTKLRQNGVALSGTESSSPDPGTGNFANGALTVAKVSAQQVFFGGKIYSIIVRGVVSDATEISNTEAYVNGKTGAY